jgi:L-rhamnose mutarotase
MSKRKLYFVLDLQNDPALIAEYEWWHRPENIWPEVLDALRARGASELELFRCGNRLVQVLEVDEQSNAADPNAGGADSSRLQDWEQFMWKFQLALPFAAPGQKWVPMNRVFSLKEALLGGGGEPEA